MNRTRTTFLGVVAVVALVFAGFAATGRPYPGQRVPLGWSDLPGPVQISGVWGLSPQQAGRIDLAPWIPVTDFGGLSASYTNPDGLVVVTFGTVNGGSPDWKVSGQRGEIWDLQIGERTGRAVVWGIPGYRWVGVAVWAVDTDLPPETDTVLRALRDANA